VTTDIERKHYKAARDKHEVRSFHVLCSYYRQFIAESAAIPKLWTKLMDKKQASQWSQEAEVIFWSLQELLYTAPTAAYPQPGEFIIDTDGSNVGTKELISQI
jgi:hypothetical protein